MHVRAPTARMHVREAMCIMYMRVQNVAQERPRPVKSEFKAILEQSWLVWGRFWRGKSLMLLSFFPGNF